jgi:hypothetical protein
VQTLHGPIGDHTSSFRTECVALRICLEYIRTTYLSNLPMGPMEVRICTDSISAVCALKAGYLLSLGLPSSKWRLHSAYVAVSGHLIQTIQSIHPPYTILSTHLPGWYQMLTKTLGQILDSSLHKPLTRQERSSFLNQYLCLLLKTDGYV